MVDTSQNLIKKEDIFLLIAGHHAKSLLELLPFQHKHLGYLKDEVTLSMAYQAADVFVCPSIDDQGPMMIPESMMCGTPVVAFDNGIAPELIVDMETGYLAQYRDSFDLAHGIYQVLTSDRQNEMKVSSREMAFKGHSPQVVAKKYIQLYTSLIGD